MDVSKYETILNLVFNDRIATKT
ncbi:hypothetical protein [Borreliella afzelii]